MNPSVSLAVAFSVSGTPGATAALLEGKVIATVGAALSALVTLIATAAEVAVVAALSVALAVSE